MFHSIYILFSVICRCSVVSFFYVTDSIQYSQTPRWLIDTDLFNEWMTEVDYELPEEEQEGKGICFHLR